MIVTFNLPLPKILSNIAAVMKVGDEAEAERKYLEIKKKLKHNNLTDFIRETEF